MLLQILLNCLMILGITVAIVLIAMVLIVGCVLVTATVGKVVDIWKSGGKQ